ncbi:MAG: hypothetical protein ACLVA2_07525 [Clostridia bacterium]
MSDIEEKNRNMKEKMNINNNTTRIKEIKKSSKGVTLIALVITIVLNCSFLAMA